uniref:G-protein coupled receptors family 2 profile 2 domain-containing protein n=2 Tax=Ciona intestinalis TaxID=7719 RepID=H2XWN7_CIOIN
MAWMFVEGIILYRKILIVLTREPQIISKRYYIIGWGVPCLISTLTLIGRTTQNLTYHNERCWLTLQDGIIWTFAGPVCFVIAFNFTILVRVLIVAAATQQRRFLRQQNRYKPTNSNQIQQNIRTVARGIFFLTPLLGLSWVLGFFAATSVVLSYVFVFTNAFQGVYLLLFYVILNPEVKCALLERKRARQRSFLAISGLGSVRTSTQNTWKQRLSFTFLNKLSLSPSTSENTSPVSNELNTQNPKEVQDFNEENLSSRPCSGRSNLNFIISPALRNRGKITPTPERWSDNLKGETNEAFMGDLGNDEYIMSRQTSGIELKKTEDQDDGDLFGNMSDDGGSSLEKLEDTEEYEQELSNEREHVKEEISHPDSESCGYADLTETTEKLEIVQNNRIKTTESKQQEHKQRIKVKQRRKSAPGELVCRSRACHVCKPHRLQHKRKKKKKTEIRAAWPEQASSNNDHCDVMTKMPVLLQNNRPQSTQSRDSGIGI